jgi:hypothetical protein
LIEKGVFLIYAYLSGGRIEMKHTLVFFLTLLVAALSAAAAPAGTIEKLIGTADVYPAGGKAWKPAQTGQKLFAKDNCRTGAQSTLEIRWANGGIMRVGEKSNLTISHRPDTSAISCAKVMSGRVWATMKKISGTGQQFSLESPTAVAGIRGTVFRMDVGDDTGTDVAVYEGKVAVGPGAALKKADSAAVTDTSARHEVQGPGEVEGPKEVTLREWLTIVAGQQIRVERSGVFKTWQFDQSKDSTDTWVKYNLERDSAMDAEE